MYVREDNQLFVTRIETNLSNFWFNSVN